MTETDHLLDIASEECAEIIQRVSKALRFGLTEVQPGQSLTNADRIVGEILDFTAVLEMLTERGDLEAPEPERALAHIREKKAKVLRYLEHSAACGRLERTV